MKTTKGKPRVISTVLGLTALLLLNGCVAAIGNRGERTPGGTLGQELMDLKKAKDTGAISESDYEAQKARLLGNKK
jgi:hypothetical protein